MDKTQEALKMAIEALDNACIKIEKWTKGGKWTAGKEASLKCKEALAQLAQDDEKRALEFENDHLKKELDAAMTMLNAQPAQEPVAWMSKMGSFTAIAETKKQLPKGSEPIALYTHPAPSCQECENLKHDLEGYMDANKELINREWQGLSDDEIEDLCHKYWDSAKGYSIGDIIDMAEQALKEKNHEQTN